MVGVQTAGLTPAPRQDGNLAFDDTGSVRRQAARVLLAAVLAGTAACFYWRRDPNALRDTLPAHQVAEVWSGGHVRTVRALRVRGDSILAEPWGGDDWATDSTLTLAAPAVDSVNLRHFSPGATVLLVGAGLLTALALAILQGLGGPGS